MYPHFVVNVFFSGGMDTHQFRSKYVCMACAVAIDDLAAKRSEGKKRRDLSV